MNNKCREINDAYEKDHNEYLDNGVAVADDDSEKLNNDEIATQNLWRK